MWPQRYRQPLSLFSSEHFLQSMSIYPAPMYWKDTYLYRKRVRSWNRRRGWDKRDDCANSIPRPSTSHATQGWTSCCVSLHSYHSWVPAMHQHVLSADDTVVKTGRSPSSWSFQSWWERHQTLIRKSHKYSIAHSCECKGSENVG